MTRMIQVKVPSSLGELQNIGSLMRAFLAWHRERHAENIDLIERYFDEKEYSAEIASLPGAYAPPQGQLLIAKVDGEPAGCVALRRLNDHDCEMKRMFVYPQFHRAGVGRALGTHLLKEARLLGYKKMRLDTSVYQLEAQRLYRRLGFRNSSPHYEAPEDMKWFLVFMEAEL